ncbi:HalOD1 output domain-containing protein [Halobaculum litoreum]|uniref:HalOD1 output domain-containing protein n=1 Tax=Halobaculum litoreum TaxID=3031998 RepID=A0ABD5XVT4_9EURY
MSGLESMDELIADPDTGALVGVFDPAVDTPSSVAVCAVAAASMRDPLDIRPMYSTVDPGCLDSLLTHGGTTVSVNTTFEFEGYELTIDSEGLIRLEQAKTAAPQRSSAATDR